MMFGKPIVACQAGGTPEVVEHGGNGLLALPGDAASLTTCLQQLIEDPALRIRFGRRSRELYELRNAPEPAGLRSAAACQQIVDAANAADNGEPPAHTHLTDEPSLAVAVSALSRVLGSLCNLGAHDAEASAHALLDVAAYPFDYRAAVTTAWGYQDEQFIAALHRGIFGRDASTDETFVWLAHLSAGGSRFDVIAGLIGSGELRPRSLSAELFDEVLAGCRAGAVDAWSLPDPEFLSALHLALLGRRPRVDSDWLSSALRQLGSGTSRVAVARALADVPEARGWGVPVEWLEALPREAPRPVPMRRVGLRIARRFGAGDRV
jgi:Glycosyl transferases group 1/Domain of unknown function (DUF4214)